MSNVCFNSNCAIDVFTEYKSKAAMITYVLLEFAIKREGVS